MVHTILHFKAFGPVVTTEVDDDWLVVDEFEEEVVVEGTFFEEEVVVEGTDKVEDNRLEIVAGLRQAQPLDILDDRVWHLLAMAVGMGVGIPQEAQNAVAEACWRARMQLSFG